MEVPSFRESNITMLGAMTANEIIDIAVRMPIIVQCKKRRLEDGQVVNMKAKVGTQKEHFKAYLGIVMNIEELVTSRRYKCMYLPLYSPFLNPIEEMWSKVKNLVRRTPFDTKNTLTPRIKRACQLVITEDFQGWIRHSFLFFQRCLNEEQKL
jgi:transposase